MTRVLDISGFCVFSRGDIGRVHVAAHRFLDRGDCEQGYHVLGEWLRDRVCAAEEPASDWVHLQWHQLVFELETDRWHEAHARFMRHLVPAASAGLDAATDGPAALWRLHLAAGHVDLPWTEFHRAARARLRRPRGRYVALHDLLALAGAGDRTSLAAFLFSVTGVDPEDRTLRAFARGFLALGDGDLRTATRAFDLALPGLPALGGSRAQNELFYRIRDRVARSDLRLVRPGAGAPTQQPNPHQATQQRNEKAS